MRCYECGYQNKASAKICIKCGTKLALDGAPSQQQDAAEPGNSPAAEGNPTMRGKLSSAPAWDKPSAPAQTENNASGAGVLTCEACSYYPLRELPAQNSPCPNCGFKGSKSEAPQKENKAEKPVSPSNAKTMRIGQVNLSKEETKPAITLTDENSGRTFTFEGDSIPLNRASLDPENSSISSTEHVKFLYSNGKWTLEDKSSNGATFIQVQDRVAVSDESIIIIGNTVYKIGVPDNHK